MIKGFKLGEIRFDAIADRGAGLRRDAGRLGNIATPTLRVQELTMVRSRSRFKFLIDDSDDAETRRDTTRA